MVSSGMTRRAVLALQLAAREQGVTAAQLAKEADIKPRAAQAILLELLGDHGNLGVMTRERIRPFSSGRQPRGYFRKK